MSYYYFLTGTVDSPRYGVMLRLSDDKDPLEKPDSIKMVFRKGPSCGSGAYYICKLDPYLKNNTYSCNGSTYLGGSTSAKNVWNGRTQRLYRDVTPSMLVDASCTNINGAPTRAAAGYVYVDQLTRGSNGFYYVARLQVGWGGGNNHFRTGPWGCNGMSMDEVLDAARQVMSMFGMPDLLLDPYSLGSKNAWANGPYRGSTYSVKCTIERVKQTANWGVHAEWLYDEASGNTYYDWFLCTEGVIPGRIRNAASLALANAMADLPEVSANSVANVVELSTGLGSFAKAVGRGASSLLRSLSSKLKSGADPRNLWLSWRYVYNTTKMDLEDYKSVTNRLLNMAGSPTFKVHGFGQGDGFEVRCLKQFSTADFNVLDYDTKRLLRTYGFQLSAYNAWDMVPFSFMVDWFAHVGPKLELAQNWNKHYDFTAVDTWYSYREQLAHGYIYFRWHGPDPSIPPTYVTKTTSRKTFTYRLADTVSIFS